MTRAVARLAVIVALACLADLLSTPLNSESLKPGKIRGADGGGAEAPPLHVTRARSGGALAPPATAEAIFAGGCFWCMEEAFEKVPGVTSAVSGYTGGTVKNPSYEQVSNGGTGHVEAVRVTFDPGKVTYAQLLEAFWHNVDPTDGSGQFCDRGDQYRPAIFVKDEEQRNAAEQSKKQLQASGRFKQGIATRIETAGPFYTAEEYHQDYYKKNPIQYRFYKFSCGRAQRLAEVWGK